MVTDQKIMCWRCNCFWVETEPWTRTVCPDCKHVYYRGENGEAEAQPFMDFTEQEKNGIPDDSHYTKGKIEPWDYIIANDLDFFEGNIVKYVTRWKYKNGIEDLKKVVVYANKLLEIAQDPNRIRENK